MWPLPLQSPRCVCGWDIVIAVQASEWYGPHEGSPEVLVMTKVQSIGTGIGQMSLGVRHCAGVMGLRHHRH